MENIEFFTIACFLLFLLFQSLVTSAKNYIVILVIMIGLVFLTIYNKKNEAKGLHNSIRKNIEELAQVSKDQEIAQGDLDYGGDDPAVKTLMTSDALLQSSLKKLARYRDLNTQIHEDIVKNLFKYYSTYAMCLIGKHPVKEGMSSMIDYRRSILNTVNTLSLQLDHDLHSDKIYGISLGLQAATHKCLNVLKNKYNVSDYVAPVAHNQVGDAMELF
jgi:hypothetical protein